MGIFFTFVLHGEHWIYLWWHFIYNPLLQEQPRPSFSLSWSTLSLMEVGKKCAFFLWEASLPTIHWPPLRVTQEHGVLWFSPLSLRGQHGNEHEASCVSAAHRTDLQEWMLGPHREMFQEGREPGYLGLCTRRSCGDPALVSAPVPGSTPWVHNHPASLCIWEFHCPALTPAVFMNNKPELMAWGLKSKH